MTSETIRRNVIDKTELPLPFHSRGKVRDTYRVGEYLLMIATDRLSAFDVILPTPIPGKGWVLTQISRFWFKRTSWLPNHLISTEWEAIAAMLEMERTPDTEPFRDTLEGRTMLVRTAKPFPVECVVRGYIAGSLWKEYLAAGGREQKVVLHDIPLPAGMREAEQLPEPIFTPATKANTGHDENISYDHVCEIVGKETADLLRQYSLKLYREAAEYAHTRDVIIADTKFEFGEAEGEILLIDEVLTPDSSRFWDASLYEPGKPQPSFDKQFVRDYLETLDWNKAYPGPELPLHIVEKTAAKYREAYRRLATGSRESAE
jgi:phosphoribosylaminoimidazole-succinocarboxamide synthase